MTTTTGTLRELCELIVDCPHFTPEWTDSGYVVIRNQNIRDGKLDLSERSYTHRQDFERRIRRAKPTAGDIIFTREAPMGEVCMVPQGLECCVGQRQVLLRPKSSVDGRYLFYALRSPYVRHQIFWNEGTGSTVSNVRIPVLEALKIPRLGVAEKPIGQMLGSLDEKIELNRKMNETLEAMAQAIFRDWFVDFGPTRRKIEGASDPIEIMGGLTADAERAQQLADLFPVRFGDNGLPEGWKERSIYDYAKITYGAPFSSARFNATGVGRPLARIRDLSKHEGGVFTDEVHKKEHVIKAGDIVVGMDGEFRAYLWHGDETLMNQRVCSFLPINIANKALVYLGIRPLLAKYESTAIGTTVIHLGKREIDDFRLVSGGCLLDRAFGAVVEPLLQTAVLNGQQGRTLAAARDLLLPKLMSGEICLREADDLLEAAQ